MGVLLSEMLAFFSAEQGWNGKSYYPPVSGPGKPLFTKGFSGPKCPHAALCRRIYSRCRLRFATSLQVPEQKARLPCRGIVSRRRRRPAAPLYGRGGQGLRSSRARGKPPPGNNGNTRLSTTYSACSIHSPAETAVFRVIVGAPPFYQLSDGRTLGTGQLSGVHSSFPGLRAKLARSPLNFQQPVAEAPRRPSRSSRGRKRRGSRAGALACFPEQAGDLFHQPFQRVVGEIHSSPPPSSASASPSSSQGGLSSYSSSGISSYSPPSS